MLLFLAYMNPNGGTARGIRVRFIASFGATILCQIERLNDGFIYDFNPAAQGFSSMPTQPFGYTREVGLGVYAMDLLESSQSPLLAGDYSISLHSQATNNQVIAIHRATLA